MSDPVLRVFLVEDSTVIRDNLIATLEELLPLRFVGWAEDEASALRWIGERSGGCDLMIVDIVLRRGSGLGVLDALRERGDAPERVVLSNHATPELRARCLAQGASRVFDKSAELEALVAHCARLSGRAAPTGSARS